MVLDTGIRSLQFIASILVAKVNALPTSWALKPVSEASRPTTATFLSISKENGVKDRDFI
jgi:hypothetical protein